MNVLVCDDDQQIVDSIIKELKKKSEETHVALRFYGFSQPSQIDLFVHDKRVLSGAVCFQRDDCRLCHPRQGRWKPTRSHSADAPGNR